MLYSRKLTRTTKNYAYESYVHGAVKFNSGLGTVQKKNGVSTKVEIQQYFIS